MTFRARSLAPSPLPSPPGAGSPRAARRTTTILVASLTVAAGSLLAGCATPVDVRPGVDAKNPVCAEVLRATPDEILGLERRTSSAQSSTAWGDPAVTLRCGVEVPGPSTDRCLSIELSDGQTMDWLNPEEEVTSGNTQPEDGGQWTFVSYGRDPAIEVVVPAGSGLEQPTAVLTEIATAVDLVPATRECLGATDVPLG